MQLPDGVALRGPLHDRYDEILTPEAVALLTALQREFGPRRADLLAARARRQAEVDAGAELGFDPATAHVRDDPDWRVADPAPGLVDRRVEITGPTDRKMAINALNSGARVWLADFEDATTPLWENLVGGQLNLIDARERRIDFTDPGGKPYALRPDDELATVVVRPRGWHLPEKHLLIDGEAMSASLFDFGLYLFHGVARPPAGGPRPYFYLPKLQHHTEARLWNDVFVRAQQWCGIPRGTIRATVLIETLPAAFCMEEILYELREHSSGLNAGRWDYLFSTIKTLRTRGRRFVLPERNAVTMTAPFMRAYTELLVRTCHRRGAHAIGGMAAFIPSRRDAEVNARALEKVRQDKQREAGDGFDGSWVAHPDLVPVCREVFDAALGDRPDQRHRLREDVAVKADELLDIAATPGAVTEAGMRSNVSVGLRYLAAWLGGTGAVAIFNLMEDAATAEISRSQIWQWIHHGVTLPDGRPVTRQLVEETIAAELDTIRVEAGPAYDQAAYDAAADLFRRVALGRDFVEFLTVPAYERMP